MYRVAIELYKHVDKNDIGPDHRLYDIWLHQKDSTMVVGEFVSLGEACTVMQRLAGNTISTDVQMENSAGGPK